MRAIEHFDKVTCKTIRNGRMTTPPRAELRFNTMRSDEFSLHVFTDLDNAECWELSVDVFQQLSATTRVIDDGTTIQVIKVLSMLRKQVAIDFDIKGRPATRVLIPYWEIKRFMRVIKKARKAHNKALHTFAKEGITEFEAFLADHS